MNSLKQINYIFSKRQKINLIILIIIMLIGSLLELIGITAIMPFVDVITNKEIIHQKKVYVILYRLLKLSNDSQFILFYALMLILLYIIKNVYIVIMNKLQFKFTYHNQQRFVNLMMNCYMEQPYLFHVSKNVSELNRNISIDISSMFATVLAVIQLMNEALVCALLVIYLLLIDRTITISLLVMLTAFALIFLKVVRKRTFELGVQIRDANVNFGKNLRQAFEGIKEIKIVNREKFYIDNTLKYGNEVAEINIKMQTTNTLPRPLLESVCVTSMLSVVALKVAYGVNVDNFIPVLSAFAIAAFRLMPSASRITTYINSITYNKAAIDNVYHDLKEIEQLKRNHKNRLENRDIIKFNYRITINNVVFAYPLSDKPVIDGASFFINKNSSVAFIGSSGAGKTTMADIILGLLEPRQGHIYCDDIDVFEKPYGWHKLLGYIPQNIYLLDDTIRNNVLFGIQEDKNSEERVLNAIENAQLGDFVRNLPEGLDTVVGERGVRLSGGQRQRIGIARALYNDPPILVLDEATSSLDNETEAAVMESIEALHGKRTMIIIAHRLTTIKYCDYIYEITGTKVILRQKKEIFSNI